MIEKLLQWFENPDYSAGVLLYKSLLGDGFMLTMLQNGADDYNRKVLKTALNEQLDRLQRETKAKADAYPEPLVADLRRGGLLMDERTILKDRMRQFANSGINQHPDLTTMAHRILEIKDELDAIYGQKNFFDQNGFMPGAASVPDPITTPADLIRRRNSVRTYITRYTKKRDQAGDPQKREAYQVKLTAFQRELHQLDTDVLPFISHPAHVPVSNR